MDEVMEREAVEETAAVEEPGTVEEAEAIGAAEEETPAETDAEGDMCEQDAGPKGHNKKLGKRGEDAAAAFLERRGYDIIERNWVCAAGEVDIIAQDDDAIHFIEVKTRLSERNGFPAEAVDAAKRKRYERMAEIFLCDFESEDTAVMFDIISILVTGEHRAFLKMHRNAFSSDC